MTINFHSVAGRNTKFYLFCSAFDVRQIMLYIWNETNPRRMRPLSCMFNLPITFNLLQLDSPNLICSLQYMQQIRLYTAIDKIQYRCWPVATISWILAFATYLYFLKFIYRLLFVLFCADTSKNQFRGNFQSAEAACKPFW